MGTILERKRSDGTTGYRAQIIVKRGGEIVHQEAKTFDREQAAAAWLERREKELKRPGGLDRRDDPTLGAVIDRYVAESSKAMGPTKAQVLRAIKTHDIASMRCSRIESADIVSFAQALDDVQPQTVGNYLSHLSAVFALADAAWGFPLNENEMRKALKVAKRLGITSKSRKHNRRPTLDELDRIMAYFADIERAGRSDVPMTKIIPFALFSTRRQEEIVTILRPDYQPAHEGEPARILVRDMKNPGEKKGNDTWCDLPIEAAEFIEAAPTVAGHREIFPFSRRTVGTYFAQACLALRINTKDTPREDRLRFHDLRHEGISRLFEMDVSIPRVAKVSGHRDWKSLKRYEHLRQAGDKYATWKWKTP